MTYIEKSNALVHQGSKKERPRQRTQRTVWFKSDREDTSGKQAISLTQRYERESAIIISGEELFGRGGKFGGWPSEWFQNINPGGGRE